MDYTDSKGKAIERWIKTEKFTGLQTKLDATKVDNGANVNGQNTTVNDSDRISVRTVGYETFPTTATLSTDSYPITSLHTFRKRDGTNVMMRAYNTVIEYFSPVTLSWETLLTGLTANKKFGFADYNINTDLHSYVYFGNGYDNGRRWSGDYTKLTSAVSPTDTTVNVSDTSGFEATGTIIIDGNVTTYSAKTPTTFTIPASSFSAAINKAVAFAPTTQTHPKGNIYMTANNRLFIAGITDVNQAVYFSKYGDATDFVGAALVLDSTATSPGIFNLGEGGGGVIGMAQDEKGIYFIKRSIVYYATLSDSLYTLASLKTFDGKSQTVGGVNSSSVFAGGNGVFFVTPDNQILLLQRLESLDYPQTSSISNIIKPTTDSLYFDISTGIVYKDKAYIACKSSSDLTTNDVVLVWNIIEKLWDSPITGWNVSEFTVYNNGTDEELYFSEGVSPNVYKVINMPTDGIYDTKASWKSKQYNFGLEEGMKQMSNLFIEGYIAPNTTLTINLYLDEEGFTKTYTTTIDGATDTAYIYDATLSNPFGLTRFGTERFGSSPDTSGKKKFRVYLGKDFKIIPFYTAQIEFVSEGQNQQWEVLTYGFKIAQYTMPYKKSLYKSFK